MADHREPNLDGDYSSSFQKTVILSDWWLIKCSNEFNGKRFGVAGTEITDPYGEKRAKRVFRSSPIITAFDVFTLESSNGIIIVIRGFLNKVRVVESGFNPEISREIIFGFPPHWEQICNRCYEGIPFSNDITTVSSSIIIDKARYSVLSPCKNNTEGNVEDSVVVAKSRDNDKTAVTERKDGRRSSGGFRKSLRLRSKSREDKMEIEFRKAENRTTTDVGDDHGLDKVNEPETFDNEAILPAADRCGGKQTDVVDNVGNLVDEPMNPSRKVGDHGSEDANKSNDVEKDECVDIDNEVMISRVGDSIGKLTSKNDMKETETSEQRKGKEKMVSKLGKKGEPKKSDGQNRVAVEAMNHPSLRSKFKEAEGKSKKSKKACKSDRNEVVVEAMNHRSLRSKVKEAEGKLKKSEKTRKSDRNEAVVEPMNHHKLKSKVKEAERKSKKSEKTRKRNRDDEVVEDPMNHRSSRSKVKEAEKNLSWAKTRRKIDFDAEVTPVKEAKKTDAGTTGSLKRSRSGRALVSPLAFWRNEIPVYDKDRNLVEVKKGDDETPTPRR